MKIVLHAPYSCFPEGTPMELPSEFRAWARDVLEKAGYDATVTDNPNPNIKEGSRPGPTVVAWVSARDPRTKRMNLAGEAIAFGERLWTIFNHGRNG